MIQNNTLPENKNLRKFRKANDMRKLATYIYVVQFLFRLIKFKCTKKLKNNTKLFKSSYECYLQGYWNQNKKNKFLSTHFLKANCKHSLRNFSHLVSSRRLLCNACEAISFQFHILRNISNLLIFRYKSRIVFLNQIYMNEKKPIWKRLSSWFSFSFSRNLKYKGSFKMQARHYWTIWKMFLFHKLKNIKLLQFNPQVL